MKTTIFLILILIIAGCSNVDFFPKQKYTEYWECDQWNVNGQPMTRAEARQWCHILNREYDYVTCNWVRMDKENLYFNMTYNLFLNLDTFNLKYHSEIEKYGQCLSEVKKRVKKQ